MSIASISISPATQPREPIIVQIQGHKYLVSLTLDGSDITHLGNWQSLADQAASFFRQHAEDYCLGTVHPPRPLSCEIRTNPSETDSCPLAQKDFEELLNSSQEDLERRTYSIYSRVIGGTDLAEPILFQAPNVVPTPPLPLERQLRSVALGPVDVHRTIPFQEYIEPNEGYPELAQPRLDAMDPGYIISTGTERSFFDLALAPHQCLGLVMIDINHRAVAYNRFNILLLIISNTIEQYTQLSDPIKSETELQDRIEQIRNLANRSPHLSSELRTHYLNELENYAKAFFCRMADGKFRLGKGWRNSERFAEVSYHKKPELFEKLQRYARSGNMIAKLGDIGDLEFFGNLPIGLIDVSNIPLYQYLDFKTKHPIKIMYTYQGYHGSIYNLVTLETELTEEERLEIREFFTLFKKLKLISDSSEETLVNQWEASFRSDYSQTSPNEIPPRNIPFISTQMLRLIRLYKEQGVHCFPNEIWVERRSSKGPPSSAIWWNVEEKDLREFASSEKAKLWAKSLAWGIPRNSRDENLIRKYLIFSDLPGWKEEFGAVVNNYLGNLRNSRWTLDDPIPEVLIQKAREWGLLETAES